MATNAPKRFRTAQWDCLLPPVAGRRIQPPARLAGDHQTFSLAQLLGYNLSLTIKAKY